MIEKLISVTGYSESDLLGRSRKANLVIARQLHWKKLRETGHTTLEIGKMYGRRHGTIISGVKHVNGLLQVQDRYASELWNTLKDKL
jgi:chromosomal replication initiation ATPase DnaA